MNQPYFGDTSIPQREEYVCVCGSFGYEGDCGWMMDGHFSL